MTILQDIYKLNPTNMITLYELDLSPCVGRYGETTTDVYRWCDGVNELGNDVVFGGVTYSRYPIQASGFDKQGNGSIPRPKLIAGNYGGIIGDLAREYNDIVGAKLTRTRTFARYLDAANFKAKNLFKKSTDITNTVWTKSNITATASSYIIPFPVGSKVSITGAIPSSYNISNATVVTSTTTSVTISGSTIPADMIVPGDITGSGITAELNSFTGNGSIITFTFAPISTQAPISGETIYSITETNTNTTHYLSQSFSATAGKTYCMSVYVYANNRSRFRMYLPGAMYTNNTAKIAYIDLRTGGWYATNTSTLNPSIEPVIGYPGWYRCSVADVAEVTASGSAVVIELASGTSHTYTGDSNISALLVCAPQISEGSKYPAEYYPENNTTINTNPYADPGQYLDKEIWTIDRKANENSAFVEWELTAPYDLIGVKIPRRQCIQNVCTWKYRSAECGYTGTAYFNIKDESVGSASQDICGKRVSSCKLRFPGGQALPYGGFPAIGI